MCLCIILLSTVRFLLMDSWNNKSAHSFPFRSKRIFQTPTPPSFNVHVQVNIEDLSYRAASRTSV